MAGGGFRHLRRIKQPKTKGNATELHIHAICGPAVCDVLHAVGAHAAGGIISCYGAS